jgi:hypothetical protein
MDLREAIIRTVCYFDLFDFPLTREEVHDWLYGASAEADEVEAMISLLVASGVLKSDNGFISLFDRDGLEKVRAERKIFSDRKWKRACRWARVFAALPGVEFVGVGNTLAYDNARDDSDIDFFIVTAPNVIWRTRFFCAAFAAMLDLRPKDGDNRDKLCLSFFVTTEALEMSKLAYDFRKRHSEEPSDEESQHSKALIADGVALGSLASLGMTEKAIDIYLYYWTRQMLALAGNSSVFELFRAANPEIQSRGMADRSRFLRTVFYPLALFPGAFMRNWQKHHFPKLLIASEERHDGSVVVSDSVLKFHVNDRRADIYDRWQKRVQSILHEDAKDHRTN